MTSRIMWVVRVRCPALLVGLVVLCAAGPAYAQSRCEGGPGNSAVAQYCEVVPDAAGDTPTIPPRGAKAGSGASTDAPRIPAGTAEALGGQGGYGAAVLALAGQDAPKAKAKADGDADATTTATTTTAQAAAPPLPPAGALKAVTAAAGSGAVLGSGLVWMLLGVLVLAAGLGWVNARRGG